MKKSLFIAACAIVAIVGCTKNEVNPVKDNSPISFQTVVGTPSTKADETLNVYAGGAFGSAAYFNSGTSDFSAQSPVYIPQSPVSSTTSGTTTTWSTATPYYWPESGSLTFFSYSPYYSNAANSTTLGATISTSGVSLLSYDVDANQSIDFMVADVANKLTGPDSNGGVKTVFRHKLAKIVGFNIRPAQQYTTLSNGAYEIYINKISIKGIDYQGSYTSDSPLTANTNGEGWTKTNTTALAEEVWYTASGTTNDNKATFTTTSVEGGNSIETPKSFSTANQYYYVLPQTFNVDNTATNKDAEIYLEYTVKYYTAENSSMNISATASAKLSDIHKVNDTPTYGGWEMNHQITYNITIGRTNSQIIWDPYVADWENASYDISIN